MLKNTELYYFKSINFIANKSYLNKAVIKTAFKINIVILNIFQMQGNLSFHQRGMDLVIITATFREPFIPQMSVPLEFYILKFFR